MPIHDHSTMTHDPLAGAAGMPLGGLMLALFLAGFTGGLTHCAGMCGSFVLAQVTGALAKLPATGFGPCIRLRAAALLPYHLGRLTTYAALGAVAGGLAGLFVALTAFKALLSAFLVAAAGLFLAQLAAEFVPATKAAGRGPIGAAADRLSRVVAPLFADPKGWRGYALGVALGFLPCGLLYAALAAAAGSGDAVAGGLAMASFAAGTAPALVAVGYGGAMLGRRWRRALRPLARSLMAVNAALLVWIAIGTLS